MFKIILLIITIIILILIITSAIILFYILKELNKRNQIKEKEVKNELNKIYMDIDINRCEEIIDNCLKKYRDKWVLINLTSTGNDYIKSDQVEELIKYITLMFITEMSDVHLFYIKCITSINSEDDLVRWVRNKSKLLVLDFVIDYNQPQ